MNFEFRHLLPADFPSTSRVWIYQSNRGFTLGEALQLEKELEDFCSQWLSHGEPVRAYANLLFGQFIVLMTDESEVSVGGCSTDGSIRFIKDIGNRYGVDLFNRQNLAFVVKDKVQVIPMNQVSYALDNGFLNAETLFFNNTVSTKEALENEWIVPIRESWMASRLEKA